MGYADRDNSAQTRSVANMSSTSKSAAMLVDRAGWSVKSIVNVYVPAALIAGAMMMFAPKAC